MAGLLAIAAVGAAIYVGVELWKRYGDKVVEFIQPAIDVVNALADAAAIGARMARVSFTRKRRRWSATGMPAIMGPPSSASTIGPPTAAGTVYGYPTQQYPVSGPPRRRAAGGPVGPGLVLVGEKGPELLHLAGHGRLDSAQATAGKWGRGGGLVIENATFGDRNVIADLDYWTATRMSGV